jgi:pSer/pThr/pTyr-binding forkhead associated (FHA) protein
MKFGWKKGENEKLLKSHAGKVFGKQKKPDLTNLLNDIVDDIERKQTLSPGSGVQVLIHDKFIIELYPVEHVWADFYSDEATIELLENSIKERVQREIDQIPDSLEIQVKVVGRDPKEARDEPFRVTAIKKPRKQHVTSDATKSENTTQRNAERATRRTQPPEAFLRIIKGNPGKKKYSIYKTPYTIGRSTEIGDPQYRLNDLAFPNDKKAGNDSVARRQATIYFDDEEGGYFIKDDGSKNATSIIRRGRVRPLKVGSAAGQPLKSGDILQLGTIEIEFVAKNS